MAIFQFCFSSCALLLMMMMTVNLRTCSGLPVRTWSSEKCQDCSLLFRDLLLNLTELLKNEDLCLGITSLEAVVSSKSETVLACTPALTQNTDCHVQRNSSFNESECMRNIMKDLDHYSAAFQSYLKTTLRNPTVEVALLSPTVGLIQSLRKKCSPMLDEDTDSSVEDAAQMWGNQSFNNRQEMCKMMRGFYARTITINRAMGYISSGEHKK